MDSRAAGHGWKPVRAILAIALLIIVVQAWALGISPTTLIIWPDSLGYLGPVTDFFERGHFTHWHGRGFVYPGFLLGVLSLSPDPGAIVYAQRSLALATSACVAACFCLLARHACQGRLLRPPVVILLTAFWLSLLAFYPASFVLVHAAMAEALFSCLLAVALLCLVMAGCAQRGGLRLSAVFVGVLASCALVYVKPHWTLAALAFPVGAGWIAARPPYRAMTWLVAGIALLAGAALFAWPEHRLRARYDAYTSQVFGPRSLYCNNADLIQRFVTDRPREILAGLVRPELDRMLSPDARAAATAAGWRRLGFDGDRCMYGPTARVIADHFREKPGAEVNYYLRSYALAALHAPGYVAVRLSRQVGSLAILPFGSTALQYTVESRAVVASQAGTDRFYRNWLDRYERRLTGSVVSPLQAVSAESTVSLLYTLSGLAMSVLTLLAGVRAWFRPLSSQARPLLACWTVIIFLVAATNVLIAVVHTFDIGPAARYSTMQSPIFVLLGFVSSLVVLADNPELVRGAGEAGPLDGRQRG